MVRLNVLNNLESEIKYSESRKIFLAAALCAFCRMYEQSRPLDSLLHATQPDCTMPSGYILFAKATQLIPELCSLEKYKH